MTKDYASRLELTCQISREAGDLTLQYFQQEDLEVELKSDNSPVTVADRAAEQLLRQRISENFPDDAIVGEEFPDKPGTSGFRWVLDPIDGTKSFVSGVPLYGTLVGVLDGDVPVVGAIYMPALREMVFAKVDGGAWYISGSDPPRAAVVSNCTKLSEARFCTTDFPSDERSRSVVARIRDASKLTRTWGDCYGYLLVALGRADIMIDAAINVWDGAAVFPILREAGGNFTDWEGRATIHTGNGVGTNNYLLDQILAITRDA